MLFHGSWDDSNMFVMAKEKEHWVHGLAFFVCGLFLGALTNVEHYLTVAIQICFGGLMAALCTFFLEFCYRPGNIFGWYMDFLEKQFRDNVKNPFRFLYKPLGGCAYCQNTWVAIAFFCVLAVYFSVSWWLILPTIFMAHLFLTILDDLFWS
jgi:hypothetical protein